ncbi:hypothetical protein RCL1_006145 [Eukaryota sp. TZLM3-RCL]
MSARTRITSASCPSSRSTSRPRTSTRPISSSHAPRPVSSSITNNKRPSSTIRKPSSRPSSSLPTQHSTFNDFALAASFLSSANCIIILAGAGMSSDSNLATYNDIAKVSAYARLGLEYDDLCDPTLLSRDPDLFYGFWGSCYNSYVAAQPHLGYTLLHQWVSRVENYFVITSNVDELFRRSGFDDKFLCQVHGSCLNYQCSTPCCNDIFRLDPDFKFNVDENTRRIQRKINVTPVVEKKIPDYFPPPPKIVTNISPKISYERPNSRVYSRKNHAQMESKKSENSAQNLSVSLSSLNISSKNSSFQVSSCPIYRYLTPNQRLNQTVNFDISFPICNHCRKIARPNVLMWNDEKWVEKEYANENRLFRYLEAHKSRHQSSKVLIIELGCGNRVPTLRNISTKIFKKYSDSLFIRINPDENLAKILGPPSRCVSFNGGALVVLKKINDVFVNTS